MKYPLRILIFCILCSGLGCVTVQHTPNSQTRVSVDFSAEITAFFGWSVKFAYQKSAEYGRQTADKSMAVLTEDIVKQGKATGNPVTIDQAKWLQTFITKLQSKTEKPLTLADVESKLAEYAAAVPVPIRKVITVDAVENASDDREKGWTRGVEVKLPAGKWQIRPVGGGWSAWRSNSERPPNVAGAWTWNVYIKRPNMKSVSFGTTGSWWEYETEKAAFNGVRDQTYAFSTSDQSSLFFWIFDDGDIENNRGYVEFELVRVT